MRSIFQFRGVGTEIEAIVVAADYERARELFQAHLRVHGGDPDTLLFRELGLEHLADEAAAAVRHALGVGRDGLVIHDDIRGWQFTTPLGDRPRET